MRGWPSTLGNELISWMSQEFLGKEFAHNPSHIMPWRYLALSIILRSVFNLETCNLLPAGVDRVKRCVVIDKEGTEVATVRLILIKGGVKMSYNHRY